MFPSSPEMFPSPVAPQTYITQSLFSPIPMFPLIHSPYVSPFLCSPVSMFPSPYVPQTCSPDPMLHRHVLHSLCPSKMFHSPYAADVFANPYIPINVHYVCSAYIPKKFAQSRSSPKMSPYPYALHP